jgi:hypothetical protein
MATRKKFISSNLYRISKHIAESTTGTKKNILEQDDIALNETINQDEESPALNSELQTINNEVEIVSQIQPEYDNQTQSTAEAEPPASLEKPETYNKEYQAPAAPTEDESLMAHKKIENKQDAHAKMRTRAIERRLQEYIGAKRALLTRITKELAIIPDSIEQHEMKIKLLKQTKETYENLFIKVEHLDDIDLDGEIDDIKLGRMVKELENSRLEYMSSAEKLKKTLESMGQINSANNSEFLGNGFALEVASLSFKQLFRIGFILSSPIIIAILIAAFLMAVTNVILF